MNIVNGTKNTQVIKKSLLIYPPMSPLEGNEEEVKKGKGLKQTINQTTNIISTYKSRK